MLCYLSTHRVFDENKRPMYIERQKLTHERKQSQKILFIDEEYFRFTHNKNNYRIVRLHHGLQSNIKAINNVHTCVPPADKNFL